MGYNLPPGVALETERGRYFIARDGKRYRVNHDRVWDSWNFPHVVKMNEFEVSNEIAISELGFRDGTFILDMFSKKIYLVSSGKRREVVSPDMLHALGLNLKNVMLVSRKEAALHTDGTALE